VEAVEREQGSALRFSAATRPSPVQRKAASWVPLQIRALSRLHDALLQPSEAQLPVVELHANLVQLLRPPHPECCRTRLQCIIQNVMDSEQSDTILKIFKMHKISK
jgi:hypothetical protein